jgi:hypothetical protein
MAAKDNEQRISQLEHDVDVLRRKVAGDEEQAPWWERIAGTFDKDPIYEQAMKLGRKYRASLPPTLRSSFTRLILAMFVLDTDHMSLLIGPYSAKQHDNPGF